MRLCIKVGRGQGDRDMGTRVWGLGTWGRETRDLRTSSMGRGDVKNRDAGDAGCPMSLSPCPRPTFIHMQPSNAIQMNSGNV